MPKKLNLILLFFLIVSIVLNVMLLSGSKPVNNSASNQTAATPTPTSAGVLTKEQLASNQIASDLDATTIDPNKDGSKVNCKDVTTIADMNSCNTAKIDYLQTQIKAITVDSLATIDNSQSDVTPTPLSDADKTTLSNLYTKATGKFNDYMEAQCNFEKSIFSDGSLATVSYGSCKVDLLTQRLINLTLNSGGSN